jgi:hypothetical protein
VALVRQERRRIANIGEKATGEGCESRSVSDPQRVGYRDTPFRSRSLDGNPGVARLQRNNAPLQRRSDILIGDEIELRPKPFCTSGDNPGYISCCIREAWKWPGSTTTRRVRAWRASELRAYGTAMRDYDAIGDPKVSAATP